MEPNDARRGAIASTLAGALLRPIGGLEKFHLHLAAAMSTGEEEFRELAEWVIRVVPPMLAQIPVQERKHMLEVFLEAGALEFEPSNIHPVVLGYAYDRNRPGTVTQRQLSERPQDAGS